MPGPEEAPSPLARIADALEAIAHDLHLIVRDGVTAVPAPERGRVW